MVIIVLEDVDKKSVDNSKDPAIDLLLNFLSENDSPLEPEFDLEKGYEYNVLEELLDRTPVEVKILLERLSEAKILAKELLDRDIKCPSCESMNISSNYACPHDGSLNIIKDSLIEHLSCGHIDSLSKFRLGDRLVCPGCRTSLDPGSYRMIASWNQCEACGRRLEVLSVLHRCRKCGEEFNFDEALVEKAYKYFIIKEGDIDREVLESSLAIEDGKLGPKIDIKPETKKKLKILASTNDRKIYVLTLIAIILIVISYLILGYPFLKNL